MGHVTASPMERCLPTDVAMHARQKQHMQPSACTPPSVPSGSMQMGHSLSEAVAAEPRGGGATASAARRGAFLRGEAASSSPLSVRSISTRLAGSGPAHISHEERLSSVQMKVHAGQLRAPAAAGADVDEEAG